MQFYKDLCPNEKTMFDLYYEKARLDFINLGRASDFYELDLIDIYDHFMADDDTQEILQTIVDKEQKI